MQAQEPELKIADATDHREPSRHVYLRLLDHVRPYWRVFALAVLAMVVLALSEAGLPMLLGPTFDGTFVDRDIDAVAWMALGIVGLFAVRGIAAFASSVAMSWVATRVIMDLRQLMTDKLLSLPSTTYDSYSSGSLISKITYDAVQVHAAATHVVTILIRDSLTVIALFAWMLYLDWLLTLVPIMIAPIVLWVVSRLGSRLRVVSREQQRCMGMLTEVVQEIVDGHKVVRSFGGEQFERGRFANAANRLRQFEVKFAAAAAANSPITQMLTAGALGVILYITALRSAAGLITVGEFVSFVAAMGLLFSPLKRLTNVNGAMQKGIAAAESVFALIDHVPEPDDGEREIGRAQGRIALQGVSFDYPSRETSALRNIELEIAPGETIALVGPSGSGKSTLVHLLMRFYQPDRGSIALDGIDIADLKLQDLRQNIALVSQDIMLFNGTIAENIAYGPLADSERAEIINAARAANADQFIEKLPRGYETEIGQDGIRLSGGQRQRIAIARAFLKNAPILILDEATSSLDSHAEREIQTALTELRRNRTTIVVAHRLSTIEEADRIVLLENGEVVDIGAHQALLRRSPLYAGLYRFQFNQSSVDQEKASAG